MDIFDKYYEKEEEKEKRLEEIEKELQNMKMEWVEMYDTIMRLIDEKD